MPTVGEKLRQARIAADRQLVDISEETKIRPQYLQCLEEDNYDELPAPFCTIPFLRQYAAAVGLDPDSLLSEVRSELPTAEIFVPEALWGASPPRGASIGKASRSLTRLARRRAGGIGKVAIAIALIASGSIWWFQSAGNGKEADSQGTGTAASAASESGTADSSAQDDPSEPALGSVGSDPSSPPTPASPAANLMSIEIQATGEVWVRSLTDGVTERSRVMNPGEVQRIEADALVNLTFGNAGAVSLTINGVVQEGIGNAGEVRHLRITRNGWEFIGPGSY